MNIKLKNIGVIEDSEVKLDGLTIITGNNNTGKSTIGKAVFSLIAAVENLEKLNLQDKLVYCIKTCRNAIDKFEFFRFIDVKDNNDVMPNTFSLYNSQFEFNSVKDLILFTEEIYDEIKNVNVEDFEKLFLAKIGTSVRFKKYQEHFQQNLTVKNEVLNILQNVIKNLKSDLNLMQYANKRIEKTIQAAFNEQIYPVKLKNRQGHKSSIKLFDNDGVYYDVNMDDDKIVSKKETYFRNWMNSAVLIDNPYWIDRMEANYEFFTRKELLRIPRFINFDDSDFISSVRAYSSDYVLLQKLIKNNATVFDEIINKQESEEILNIINKVFPYEPKYVDGKYVVGSEKLNIKNLATGTKMFAIIKTLIEKGHISNNTFLVLDEPEAHLHPEWQNIFAEIIVLLSCKVGTKILLTTHSPNFVLAIETYMNKYKSNEITNFYLNEKKEDGYMVNIRCVNNCLDEIYSSFVKPYQHMYELHERLFNGEED